MLDRPRAPKPIVKVQGVLGAPCRGPGPQDLQLSPPAELWQHSQGCWNIESKWTMFHISIAEAAVRSCGCKVIGVCHGRNPLTRWRTLEVKGTIKLKESYETWLACGTWEAGIAGQVECDWKHWAWEEFGKTREKTFGSGYATQEGTVVV